MYWQHEIIFIYFIYNNISKIVQKGSYIKPDLQEYSRFSWATYKAESIIMMHINLLEILQPIFGPVKDIPKVLKQ